MMMTRPIGDRFSYENLTLEVVCQDTCTGCFLEVNSEQVKCRIEGKITCGACDFRSDGRSVIFKRVEP